MTVLLSTSDCSIGVGNILQFNSHEIEYGYKEGEYYWVKKDGIEYQGYDMLLVRGKEIELIHQID